MSPDSLDLPTPFPTLTPHAAAILASADNVDSDYLAVLATFKARVEEDTRLSRLKIRDTLRVFLAMPPTVERAREAAEWDYKLCCIQSREGGFGPRALPWVSEEWEALIALYHPPCQLARLGNVGQPIEAHRKAFQARRNALDRGE